MRRLLLLRHAKAAREAGGGDRERPLTERGRADAAKVGRYLASERLTPHLAVASDARRTRETLECLATAMNRHFKQIIDPNLYLAEPSTLLSELHAAPDIATVLLCIGHNPGLALFCAHLASESDDALRAQAEDRFPTATLAVLNFEAAHWADIEWGQGKLERLMTPNMLPPSS